MTKLNTYETQSNAKEYTAIIQPKQNQNNEN